MSTPAIHKISLPPEALAALEADGAVKFDKPLPDKAIRVIRQGIAKAVFGPSMKPTFKSQLLTFVSFAAIKASWAADHWQRRQRERTHNP